MSSILDFVDKSVDEIEAILKTIPNNHPLKVEIDKIIRTDPVVWRPLPGPQAMAANSTADIVGFGGSAGGGKTDLGIGLAFTQHRRTFIVRHEATQLSGIIDRIADICGSRDGYNGQDKIFRLPKRYWHRNLNKQIAFGSVPNPGDERKYQGIPKDLILIDECTNILESQVRFLIGWLRTTDANQRTRVLLTFNPPTDSAGRWVINFFGPWLDKHHPIPAKPGELRWFGTVNDQDLELTDNRPFVLQNGKPYYDFEPDDFTADEIIEPMSRTFIPSRITDNPYLLKTGYMRMLQGLPEPLRSQMLYGDFEAGVQDSAWQVCPTAWVDAAMARWRNPDKKAPMDSVGVDVARGGIDKTVIARRHGQWYDMPLRYPGESTPDGPKVAGLTVAAARDMAVIHIDVIGVGASPYDFLQNAHQQVIGVNASHKATKTDRTGKLTFRNQRSQDWWGMRELLDPANNTGIALPPDKQLKDDLCAPEWNPKRLPQIYVESREEIIQRIGRSPDTATAYLLAARDTPKAIPRGEGHNSREQQYDPYAYMKQ